MKGFLEMYMALKPLTDQLPLVRYARAFNKVLCVIIMACLMSCSKGGGSPEVTASKIKISKTFSDSTVTNFTQTGGVASVDKRWFEYIIERAYAGTGDISCFDGQSITVDMDITLGSTTSPLIVDSTCGSDVELDIRRKMLSALDGHKMILEVAGQGSVGVNFILDFTQAEGFQFDVPYLTYEEDVTHNAVTRSCYMDYTFNSSNGTVSNNTKSTTYNGRALELNELSNTAMGIGNPNSTNNGCKSDDEEYRNASFRFKDGKIELDESGTDRFSPNGCALRDGSENIIDYKENGDGSGACPDMGYDSTYERWCVDDDLNGTCD